MECAIIALSPTRSVRYRHATHAYTVHAYAIITHSIARQRCNSNHVIALRQQNQPGLPDFSRETLKNMGRPGSRLS